MEETLLVRMNDNLEKMNTKIDDQSGNIREISVKLDFYGNTQREHARKIEVIEKETAKILPLEDKVKKIEKAIIWVTSIIIGAVIIAVVSLVIKK